MLIIFPMNYDDTVLKESIMRRVRFVYAVKNNALPFALKFAVFASLVAAGSFFVSVPHVIRNMPSLFEVKSFAAFFVAAFLNTKMVIQAISVATLALLFFMLRDIRKTFRGSRQQFVSI